MVHFVVNGSHIQLLSLVHVVIILDLCFCKEAVLQKRLKLCPFVCDGVGMQALEYCNTLYDKTLISVLSLFYSDCPGE